MTTQNKIALAAAVAATAAAGFSTSARASVVIQEVYADGGYSAGFTFSNDYVDLYNAGSTPVNINGYTIESGGYSAALGTSAPVVVTDSVPLAAGAYFLIEGRTAGTNPGVSTFPQPNELATQNASLGGFYPSYSAGKIGLFDQTGALQDFVGYGDNTAVGSAPAFEGTGPAANFTSYPVFSGTNAITRTVFTDATATGPDTSTENNASDFVIDSPNPQTTATTAVPEPTALGIVAAGGAMLVARRRRQA